MPAPRWRERTKYRNMTPLDDAVIKAIDRHERLLHLKTLELLLGSMVARSGVREVRRLLLWYARRLREFG